MLSPILQDEETHSEKLNNLYKATELVRGRSKTQIQVKLTLKSMLFPLYSRRV